MREGVSLRAGTAFRARVRRDPELLPAVEHTPERIVSLLPVLAGRTRPECRGPTWGIGVGAAGEDAGGVRATAEPGEVAVDVVGRSTLAPELREEQLARENGQLPAAATAARATATSAGLSKLLTWAGSSTKLYSNRVSVRTSIGRPTAAVSRASSVRAFAI